MRRKASSGARPLYALWAKYAALGGADIAHRHASLCGLGSSADDPNVGRPLGGRLRSDDDLDVLIEAIQEPDEPVGREPGDLAPKQ